jgi:glyoxylase-like metal-dependent hydrolase (beta-lactamase superfamily II)
LDDKRGEVLTKSGKAEVLALKIKFEYDGVRTVYPALLCDDKERILVDCGYPGFLPLLEKAVSSYGISFSDITGVLITHHDYDHCGAASEIKEKYPDIVTMSSEFDAPYIDGRKKSLRLMQATELSGTLSGEKLSKAKEFMEKLEAAKPAPIDQTLRSGAIMPWCGGTEIIHTPGHMPGHISLFVREQKTVITGDALVTICGKLQPATLRYATDPESAKKSARKLLDLDATTFICYHGGVINRL